jgi:hypothetical protein
MSRNVLRIDLTELTTVRVICKKCNRGVIEVPVNRLETAFDHGECRFCNHQHLPRGHEPLNDLRVALMDLIAKAEDLGIEFEARPPD